VDRLSFLESKSSDDMDFYRQRLKQDLVNYECFKDILNVDMEPSQDDGCESTSFSISDKAQGKLISIANRKIIERE
jgi:hypothetical protein